MGVVNITPDSFSDGGAYSTTDKVFSHIDKLLEDGIDIIDIGAESTAPFNDPIDANEEISRFDQLLLRSENLFRLNHLTLSIDTYRPEVFEYVAKTIFSKSPKANILWNDVSGVFDKKTVTVLEKFPAVHYVYSHNFSPTREETSNHMSFVKKISGDELIKEVISNFQGVLGSPFASRIILDPCFGFSKDHDQNIFLLDHMSDLLAPFNREQQFLVGISRKSFLQKLTGKEKTDLKIKESEYYHVDYLKKILLSCKERHFTFRIHDPQIMKLLI